MDCRDRAATASTCTTIGLCLLPSELLEEIFCRLALPDIIRLRSVSRSLGTLLSADPFQNLYSLRCGGCWVFVLKKRPPRELVLCGFNDRAGQWFKFPITRILAHVLPRGEDIYFLAASGDFFLFVCNGCRELIVVDLPARTVRKIPHSPLGPRGTSSWRRSGLKLMADQSGSNNFRFVFAEMHENIPCFFEYNTETDTWRSTSLIDVAIQSDRAETSIILNVAHYGSHTAVVCANKNSMQPTFVVRPRFAPGDEGRFPFSPIISDRSHIYGDGNVVVIRSVPLEDDGKCKLRIVTAVELCSVSKDGREWELISRVPKELVDRVTKPFGVMTGCVHEKNGVIRIVLLSNCKGCLELLWLAYDKVCRSWSAVPVPDSGTKGMNMAGIALSSSCFSKFRPSVNVPPVAMQQSSSSYSTFLSSLK